MKILVINCGSSSIKYQLFLRKDWSVCAFGSVSRIGENTSEFTHRWTGPAADQQRLDEAFHIADHNAGLTRIMRALTQSGGLGSVEELEAIGHRVVHGGEAFSAPIRIDQAVIDTVREMIPMAPLHNPPNLEGIQVARELFPQVPQVAVFDTAFHQSMPREAYRYAIPDQLYRDHKLRRYGFHGTSHHYVGKRAAAFLGIATQSANLITLHLGNGASATAIKHGLSVDTSMGMTPLEGLIMGTRCGDIDPALHFFLCRELDYGVDDLDRLLNKESGLLGLAGVNDMREIHARAEAGDERAELARGMMVHRLRKYLGAYYVELGRVDALVFTGGIGENDAWMRERTCADLAGLGIQLDPAANRQPSREERDLASADSRVRVLVIPTNEELEIAQQAVEALEALEA